MDTKKCSECGENISLARLRIIPHTTMCVECQKENDVFKFKMKIVGFDDEATIARNKKDWDLLKKQKKVRDI